MILIARVHQLGNIVKSTPILHALRAAHDPAWIAWLTAPAAAPLLRGNPLLDEVIEYRWENVPLLLARRFDLVVALEADPAEVALAQMVPAGRRLGYALDPSGKLVPAGPESVPFASLSISDQARFRENTLTVPELLFQLVGVPYEGQETTVCLSAEDKQYARQLLCDLGVDPGGDTVIALATGGNSARFETKDWPPEHFAALARLLSRETDARLLLVGGPAEEAVNSRLAAQLGELVIDTGCHHSITQFCALLSLCDLVISADAFPLQAAVAVGSHVVGVFGPTPPQEIPLFGRGRKVVTDMPCGPCYIRSRSACPHAGACMPGITPERVLAAAREVLAELARP